MVINIGLLPAVRALQPRPAPLTTGVNQDRQPGGAASVEQGGTGNKWGHPNSCLLLVQEDPSPEAAEDLAAVAEVSLVLAVPCWAFHGEIRGAVLVEHLLHEPRALALHKVSQGVARLAAEETPKGDCLGCTQL